MHRISLPRRCLDRVEANLERDLAAILAQPVQVAALHRFVLVEGFPVLPVALAIPLRQERLYRQIGQFLPRVSEHPFHSRVDHADFAAEFSISKPFGDDPTASINAS
jgi:hypothetical protein